MNEEQAKALDKEALDSCDIDPYSKLSAGLVLVIHRQLLTLSQKTNVPVEKMDREFLIAHLSNIKISTPLNGNSTL